MALTMKDLEYAMKIQYRIQYSDAEAQEDEDELALSAFEGKCYKCVSSGHKANKCPTKKKQGKFSGK